MHPFRSSESGIFLNLTIDFIGPVMYVKCLQDIQIPKYGGSHLTFDLSSFSRFAENVYLQAKIEQPGFANLMQTGML